MTNNRVNYTMSNSALIYKRTSEKKVSQDFRIDCKNIWHYGQGKYSLYKW